MKNENAASGSSSGTTSPTASPKLPSESESAFLTRQATDAQAALGQVLQDLVKDLGKGINPVAWGKQYPWVTVGTAAAAGFVVANLVTPRKQQSIKAKWNELVEELSSKRKGGDDNTETIIIERLKDSAREKAGGFFSKFSGPLMDLVKTTLASTISATVAGKAAAASADPAGAGNGHP